MKLCDVYVLSFCIAFTCVCVSIPTQECLVYLCGTKWDLVEENKKARKVDSHVVREYSDGKE